MRRILSTFLVVLLAFFYLFAVSGCPKSQPEAGDLPENTVTPAGGGGGATDAPADTGGDTGGDAGMDEEGGE
ncbi:MAG: hypothetical protein HRF49_07370 [bacterium]|jgi:hypothetical protein